MGYLCNSVGYLARSEGGGVRRERQGTFEWLMQNFDISNELGPPRS